MERIPVSERKGWRRKLEEIGFTFHSAEGTYWDERACYAFSADEVDRIEEATEELHHLCLKAVDYVVKKGLYGRLGIPEQYAPLIRSSWKRRDRSLYGRFDLSLGPRGELKLLEYNADTPTSLIEASIAQWTWLEEKFPDLDQFNSLHEKLLESFEQIRRELGPTEPFYFSCVRDDEEDLVNLEYLRDLALQAGLDARFIYMEEIGFSDETRRFCDLEEKEIRYLFKLYPWEWMMREPFGEKLLLDVVRWLEPPWKLILSGKGILPVLWEMAPGHPHLLPAYFEPGRIKGPYVEKPLFAREGANVTFHEAWGPTLRTDGPYGAEGTIVQQTAELPCFDGHYAVIGSWIVGGRSAGMGIREDETPITRDTSRFVPHFFYP
ncbi:MAG: glutathionylspermidine synthase family protein [Desulfobacterota bacterium]|jgi:glutathionylspermidine synthase|nr:glutathionylspermidine synthase family protein [Thermodesulfobacteriota bacterium]